MNATGRRAPTHALRSSSTWRSSTTGNDGIQRLGMSARLRLNAVTSRNSGQHNLGVYEIGASPDIGMPGEDGYALLSRVRAQRDARAQIPAIALTAFASP